MCFASNDYLGLSQHPQVIRAACEAAERYGAGARSSRLICGTRSLHVELEDALACAHNVERALVFSSGYAANLAVLSTLGAADVTIFSDSLNHASIIDGCRLAKARTVVYRHTDVAHLKDLMSAVSGLKIVVTDTVFSMDGDIAPLPRLARVCAEQNALLIVDEAHADLGPTLPRDTGATILRVGTLSKTLGAHGGWVGGSAAFVDLLINRARTFIYTTGLSPPDTAAALAALHIYMSPAGTELRLQLRRNVDQMCPHHGAPIVPIVLGSEKAALGAATHLRTLGLVVPAIRPPTVLENTARLRIVLSATHTPAMVARLKIALADLPTARQG